MKRRDDIANVETAAAWDGEEGAHWASYQLQFDTAIRPHHAHLLQAAAIGRSEAVLDVGCGNGQSTRDAARAASSRPTCRCIG